MSKSKIIREHSITLHGKEKSPKTGFLFGNRFPGYGAFNQDRTGDLILTMDALYLLSYKGRSHAYLLSTSYSLPSTKQKVKQKKKEEKN